MSIWAYIIPLICGFVVSAATLALKRATEGGEGVIRVLFLNNWIFFLMVVPAFLIDPELLDTSRWWGPVVAGVCSFVAGVFFILSIRAGQVSIQTPLMGTKVIFVASYSMFIFANPIPMSWWVGTFLTFFAIMIIGFSDMVRGNVSIKGIVYTLITCALYAMRDVIIAAEAPAFGRMGFIMATVSCTAVLTLTLIPFFRGGLFTMSKSALKWGLIGSALRGIQNLGLLVSLGYFGMPTVINIMYGTRGVWGILLVWLAGGLFGITEQAQVGHRVLFRRMMGAILLCIAIVIVLSEPGQG